jgi:hypothetical protein
VRTYLLLSNVMLMLSGPNRDCLLSGLRMWLVSALPRSRFLQGKDTDRLTVKEMATTIAAGKVFLGRLLNYTKDGHPIWNYLLMQPLRNPGEYIRCRPLMSSQGSTFTPPLAIGGPAVRMRVWTQHTVGTLTEARHVCVAEGVVTHYTALQMFVDSEDAAKIAEVAKEMSGVADHMEDTVIYLPPPRFSREVACVAAQLRREKRWPS